MARRGHDRLHAGLRAGWASRRTSAYIPAERVADAVVAAVTTPKGTKVSLLSARPEVTRTQDERTRWSPPPARAVPRPTPAATRPWGSGRHYAVGGGPSAPASVRAALDAVSAAPSCWRADSAARGRAPTRELRDRRLGARRTTSAARTSSSTPPTRPRRQGVPQRDPRRSPTRPRLRLARSTRSLRGQGRPVRPGARTAGSGAAHSMERPRRAARSRPGTDLHRAGPTRRPPHHLRLATFYCVFERELGATWALRASLNQDGFAVTAKVMSSEERIFAAGVAGMDSSVRTTPRSWPGPPGSCRRHRPAGVRPRARRRRLADRHCVPGAAHLHSSLDSPPGVSASDHPARSADERGVARTEGQAT